MEDEEIIALFFARAEQALRETDQKYGGLCRKLSFQILNDRQDAEECVNDAYLGAWNAIPPTHPNPLMAFLCKIVRNLSLRRFHANTAQKRNSTYCVVLEELEEVAAASDTPEDLVDAKAVAQMVEGFLAGLSRENRVIFLRRYWFSDSYAQIAQRTGLSEKNISVRLSRMRKQLRRYLREREVSV